MCEKLFRRSSISDELKTMNFSLVLGLKSAECKNTNYRPQIFTPDGGHVKHPVIYISGLNDSM